MSNVKAIACVLALTAGCAKNPALSPKPNGAPLTVSGDERLWGDQPVDEQDYYHLAGDTTSEQIIRDKRAEGGKMQTIGGIVIASGIGVAAGGIAMWQLGGDSLMKPGIGIAAVGLLVGLFTGKTLIRQGNHTVRGEDADGNKILVFDREHAQKAVERGTFGDAGLTTKSMKTLALTVDDPDGPTVCLGGHVTVEAKVTDTTGAPVANDRLRDVVEWTTTVDPDPKRDYSITIEDTSLTKPDLWTQPIEVTAHLVGNEAVKAHLTIRRTLEGCQTARIGGEASRGEEGTRGFNGNGPGQKGTRGGDGKDGHEGHHEVAEAAWVKTSIAPKVLLVVDEYGNWSIGSRASVTAEGGPGGKGGNGGNGGDTFARSTHPDDDCADTGDGGYGGDGGNGGDGGLAELRYASDDILDHVSLTAPGGSAGRGGQGGDPGKDCDGDVAGRGRKGMDGRDGKPGKGGSDKTTKVPLAKLAWIKKFLAEHPELTLIEDEPAAPKKRR